MNGNFVAQMFAFGMLVASTAIPLFVHLLLAYNWRCRRDYVAARKSLHASAILISLTFIEIVFGIIHFGGFR
jgi:hypothetical protein